jgi:hypothetical protein
MFAAGGSRPSGVPRPNEMSGAWGRTSVPGPARAPARPPYRLAALRTAIRIGLVVLGIGLAILSLNAGESNPGTSEPSPSVAPVPVLSGEAPPVAGATSVTYLVNIADLRVGDCWAGLDVYGPDSAGNVRIFPCDWAHMYEVIWTGSMPDGPFPKTDDAFYEYLFNDCDAAFLDYVGTPTVGSALTIDIFHPTAEAWQAGDRSLSCSAYDLDANLTASIKGSRR